MLSVWAPWSLGAVWQVVSTCSIKYVLLAEASPFLGCTLTYGASELCLPQEPVLEEEMADSTSKKNN